MTKSTYNTAHPEDPARFGRLRGNTVSAIGAAVMAMAFMGPATSIAFNTAPGKDRLRTSARHPARFACLPDPGFDDRRIQQEDAIGRLRVHLQHPRIR
jgi:hypothetical protein